MEREIIKSFSHGDVIASLFALLPSPFPNDPQKIHETIRSLQKEEKYKDLLGDFEFIDYYPYPYSPLLGRILNMLQESRLMACLNPDYNMYVMEPASKKAIKRDILGKKLKEQRSKLEEIASELKQAVNDNR